MASIDANRLMDGGAATQQANVAATTPAPAADAAATTDQKKTIQPVAGTSAAAPANAPPPSPIPNPYPAAAPGTDPGILANAMPAVPTVSSTPTAGATQGYGANKATGTDWMVDAPQTVQGQIKGIIDQNSPLMQQAVSRANEQMNSRGLLNSSIGVGAAQGALYDAAMPIATADANTYANAGRYKADVANSTSQFNANASNTANQFTAQQQNEALQADAKNSLTAQVSNQDAGVKTATQQYDGALKIAMQNADSATKMQLQNVDAFTKQTLAQIEAQYKTQMQTSSSMSSTYQSMIDGITRIMQDKDLDGPGKQQAIANLTTMYNGAMQQQQAITGLNLGSLLDPSAFGGGSAAGSSDVVPGGGSGSAGYYDPNNMPGGQ